MKRSIAFALAATLAAALPAAAESQPWSKVHSGKSRFKVLKDFASEAVLDRETGLVWLRKPFVVTGAWSTARLNCRRSTVGGRMGWRLPTVAEQLSLADATGGTPVLPEDHPFDLDLPTWDYWTATTADGNPGIAIVVTIEGFDLTLTTNKDATPGKGYWCVRGGSGPDGQDD